MSEKKACQCPNTECANHSNCEACQARHEGMGNLPHCQR